MLRYQSGMTVDILQCETTETAEYSQTHYDFGVEITFSIEAEECSCEVPAEVLTAPRQYIILLHK